MAASVRRGFADIAEGQMHYRIARPAEPTGRRPLVMFGGAAESARSMLRLIARIGETRTTVGFDCLGQGDSSPPRAADVDMAYFADAAARAIDALGPEFAKVDAFGTQPVPALPPSWRSPGRSGSAASSSMRCGAAPRRSGATMPRRWT